MLIVLFMTACHQRTVYDRYLHTSRTGWERNDTLTFRIPPMQEGGEYTEEVGVRISGDYPFLGLTLVVEQTKLNTHERQCDTLECSLIDKNGRPLGNGITHYQYRFHLKTLRLEEHDSLRIAIRHDMKREMLPGITEIGVKLNKTKGTAKSESDYGPHPVVGR